MRAILFLILIVSLSFTACHQAVTTGDRFANGSVRLSDLVDSKASRDQVRLIASTRAFFNYEFSAERVSYDPWVKVISSKSALRSYFRNISNGGGGSDVEIYLSREMELNGSSFVIFRSEGDRLNVALFDSDLRMYGYTDSSGSEVAQKGYIRMCQMNPQANQ